MVEGNFAFSTGEWQDSTCAQAWCDSLLEILLWLSLLQVALELPRELKSAESSCTCGYDKFLQEKCPFPSTTILISWVIGHRQPGKKWVVQQHVPPTSGFLVATLLSSCAR